MLIQVIVRTILGVVFASLGYLTSVELFPKSNIFNIPYVIPIVLTFVFGVAGVFLVPIISMALAHWSSNFAKKIASEVIEQVHFPDVRKKVHMARNNSVEKYPNAMVLDTSAIIDGRLSDIVTTGFLAGTLIVPRFVLSELQHIADSSDELRRGRGRRGFEILEALKKSDVVKVEIIDQDVLKVKNTDDKLLKLAKSLKAKIVTTDYNLNKVATLSGVKILNVNELANSVKTVVLPGELMSVRVIQEGKEKDQGVGYLPDGTMIVVENGSRYVGKTVEAVVSRVLQTVAGRMIFVQVK
ncbi:MAG: hypothetical protein M1150_01920 [Patescibacteria group bacterium]|nr:hypothetical protein [Patescibacteria group bacterium]